MREHVGEEDIVGVVRVRARVRCGEARERAAARRRGARVGGARIRLRHAGRVRVARERGRTGVDVRPDQLGARDVPGALGRAPLGGVRARPGLRHLGRIEEHGRGLELVGHEHEHAEEQDRELHRHLDEPVQEEPQLALARRARGEDAAHLRLIGAEVGELEEEAAEEPRPQIVAARRIERGVERAQLPGPARHRERAGEPHSRRQRAQHQHERERQCAQDDAELERVRRRHGARAAEHDRAHDERAQERARRAHVPAEDHRQHERRRVERDPGGEPALGQEERRRERARFPVEALLQELVRRAHAQPLVDRHQRRAQDDHGDRQAEVELDEREPADVALTRRGHECHRARLRGHDRKRHERPRHAPARDEESREVARAARAHEPVDDEGGEGRDQHPRVGGADHR